MRTPTVVRATEYYKTDMNWWHVEFDCHELTDHPELRDKIYAWAYANCNGTLLSHHPSHSYYVARYASHAGFRSEEDAMMCYLAFC